MEDLTENEMDDLLRTTRDGVLALSDGEDAYCIPFGFIYVGGAVYLSMFPTGKKWTYLTSNPLVCFNAYRWNDDHSEWASVVIKGRIEIERDMGAIESVVKAQEKKLGLDPAHSERRMEYYRKNLDNPGTLKILKIRIEAKSGRKERCFYAPTCRTGDTGESPKGT